MFLFTSISVLVVSLERGGSKWRKDFKDSSALATPKRERHVAGLKSLAEYMKKLRRKGDLPRFADECAFLMDYDKTPGPRAPSPHTCGVTVDCLMQLLSSSYVPGPSIDLSTAAEVARTNKDDQALDLGLVYRPFQEMVSNRKVAEFMREVNLLELQKFKARVTESTAAVFIPYIEWYSVENRYAVMDNGWQGCPAEMVLGTWCKRGRRDVDF